VPGYELLGILGRGGMGIVYRARDLWLDRLVALKMMLASAEATERSRFRSEALAVARLQHPNIVQIYEVGERDGLPYFALEYVEGGNLKERLGDTPVAADQAATLLEVVARAVHFAHQRGIIHRDLKPANILLAPSPKSEIRNPKSEKPSSEAAANNVREVSDFGFRISEFIPKIADFGLAKRLDQDSAQTRTGALVGTPSFMAPEQAVGKNQEIGPATDVYALGALLYTLLTGRPPFQGSTVFETLEQVRIQEPVPPTHLQPKVPRDLETICLKCLQKEPRKRYASAEAVADDLRCFLAGEPIRARPTPVSERVLKWVKRRPTAAALAAVTIVGAAGLIGGAFLHQKHVLEAALRDQKRVAAQEKGAQDLVVRSETAKGQGNLQQAKDFLGQALAKIGDEDSLTELVARIRASLAEVDRQLAERAARQDAVQTIQEFRPLHREAMFQGTMFTGGDLPTSLEASRLAALDALCLFGMKGDSDPRPVFGDSFTADEKTAIITGCYELLLVLAESQSKEQPRQALATLEQARQLGPRTKAFHLRRARYLELLGDRSAAKEKEEAAQCPAAGALDHFLVGDDLNRQGKLLAAISEFEAALRMQPDHFWARYFLAVCYLRLPQPAARSARDCLSACLAKQQDYPWLYVLRGFAHGQLLQFAAAEEDFQQALKHKPSKEAQYSVFVNRGVLRTRRALLQETLVAWFPIRGDFAPAVADLHRAINLKPERYQAYMNLATAYKEQRNPAAALEQLDKAIKISRPLVESRELEPSALTRLYQYRAELHRQRRDLKAALADLDRAIEAEPGDRRSEILAVAHAERGRILFDAKKYWQAVAAYDAALKIRPELAGVHRWRAEALVDGGHAERREDLRRQRFESASQSFDQYLKHGGEPSADFYKKRGENRARLHKYPGAIADYEQALTFSPDSVTYAARGWIHVVSGANESALHDFEEAIRRDPKNGDAHNGRGLMRAKLGLSSADADAEEALRLGPKTARHFWSAARIYAELVGRIDADVGVPSGSARRLADRFDYQHQALILLRQALGLTDDTERATFWQGKIEDDKTFRPIRSSPGYAQLRAEFAAKK
jgi:tetratricopeptide (TPR) repeat protein